MNKEEKVISLKLAQEFQKIAKEKDFKLPESEYCWCNLSNTEERKKNINKWEIMNVKEIENLGEYPAYDTAELGEMLPDTIFEQNIEYSLTAKKYYDDMFSIGYVSTIHDEEIAGFLEETEAKARCKMLIYLIKNGLKNTIK